MTVFSNVDNISSVDLHSQFTFPKFNLLFNKIGSKCHCINEYIVTNTYNLTLAGAERARSLFNLKDLRETMLATY